MVSDIPEEVKEPKTLCDRLRGLYNMPINDGLGPIDGKDIFTRNFETNPIQRAAADRIELLEKRQATSDALIADLVNTLEFAQIASKPMNISAVNNMISGSLQKAFDAGYGERKG